MPANQIYIVALDTYDKIGIQYIPEDVNHTRKANISGIAPIGRNLPNLHHMGGSESVSFRIDINAELEDKSDVLRKVRWLQARTYTPGINKPVTPIMIVFGQLFAGKQFLIESVTANLSLFDRVNDLNPVQAFIDLNLAVYSATNTLRSDILI